MSDNIIRMLNHLTLHVTGDIPGAEKFDKLITLLKIFREISEKGIYMDQERKDVDRPIIRTFLPKTNFLANFNKELEVQLKKYYVESKKFKPGLDTFIRTFLTFIKDRLKLDIKLIFGENYSGRKEKFVWDFYKELKKYIISILLGYVPMLEDIFPQFKEKVDVPDHYKPLHKELKRGFEINKVAITDLDNRNDLIKWINSLDRIEDALLRLVSSTDYKDIYFLKEGTNPGAFYKIFSTYELEGIVKGFILDLSGTKGYQHPNKYLQILMRDQNFDNNNRDMQSLISDLKRTKTDTFIEQSVSFDEDVIDLIWYLRMYQFDTHTGYNKLVQNILKTLRTLSDTIYHGQIMIAKDKFASTETSLDSISSRLMSLYKLFLKQRTSHFKDFDNLEDLTKLYQHEKLKLVRVKKQRKNYARVFKEYRSDFEKDISKLRLGSGTGMILKGLQRVSKDKVRRHVYLFKLGVFERIFKFFKNYDKYIQNLGYCSVDAAEGIGHSREETINDHYNSNLHWEYFFLVHKKDIVISYNRFKETEFENSKIKEDLRNEYFHDQQIKLNAITMNTYVGGDDKQIRRELKKYFHDVKSMLKN